MHPAQFTILNAPNPKIVHAAIADLAWHARLLDALGTPCSSKIVIHVGGLYEGRDQSLRRFAQTVRSLDPAIARRLVVEHDDRLFSAHDALEAAARTGLPVVFDWLHHWALPSPEPVESLMGRVFATWRNEDGVPKIHLSSQAPGGPRGAHADFIDVDDALELIQRAPARPYDCMLEAKRKDEALMRLRAGLRERGVGGAA